jgi:hypothetical protein
MQGHRRHLPPPNIHPNLAKQYPSIILTCRGKAEAMEEQTKLLGDLTASISSMNAKLEDIHHVVLELST